MWVSAFLHSILTIGPAHLAVLMTARAATEAPYEPPVIGVLGLCISVGHFMHDFTVILRVGCDNSLAMLLHHVLSGGLMGWVVLGVPRAVWWACLLQCTEAVVPVQCVLFLLERHGHDKRRTVAYAAARWVHLLLWLPYRIAILVYFDWTVYHDWATLSTPMRILGWGAGLPLGLFNLAGLFMVVLPGWPWSPRGEKRA